MLDSHLLLCCGRLGKEEAALTRRWAAGQVHAGAVGLRRGGPYPLYAMSLTDMLRPAGLAGEERFMRRSSSVVSGQRYCRWPCLKRARDEEGEGPEDGGRSAPSLRVS
jgi:hypothetical protein